MKKKIFTLSMLLMLFAFATNIRADEKIIETYGGETGFGSDPGYGKWYYFSFETGEVTGSSDFVLEDLNAANIGTEVPDAEWSARTDWDIAFHVADIRTNGLTAVLIADTTSEKSLDEVFSELTVAPSEGFEADELLTGTFIASMTAMPPARATQISGCKATQGWASYGMTGTVINSMVVVFRLADGKYVKVYLKEFENEEGKPGYIKMEYAEIDSPTSNLNVGDTQISVYPNPATDMVHVVLPESAKNVPIVIYGLSGSIIKQVSGQAGINTISVSDLPGGMYIVKANKLTKKVIVK